VKLHGLVDRPTLIAGLRAADILLLCYRVKELKHVVANSHKLLEYLSTGAPVVATETAEFARQDGAQRQGLVLMADARSGFVELVDRAVRDFDALGSTDLRRARSALAAERSAGRMLDRMTQLIAQR
jgi:hypothetical protein